MVPSGVTTDSKNIKRNEKQDPNAGNSRVAHNPQKELKKNKKNNKSHL